MDIEVKIYNKLIERGIVGTPLKFIKELIDIVDIHRKEQSNYCSACNKPIRMINNTLQLLCECNPPNVSFYCNDEIHFPKNGRCEIECEMCKQERLKQ